MKKIKYIDIKNLLIKNSVDFNSAISDDDEFLSIKTISNASNKDLSSFSNSKYLNQLKNTNAKACLIENNYTKYLPSGCEPIILKDPYLALALISNLLNDQNLRSSGIISQNSNINPQTKIKKNFQINQFSSIYENTELCENVYIGSNCNIGPNVLINKNTIIYDNVTISNSVIMEDCIIKSGARIGGTGFGFEMKTKQKINHSGNVVIGKNSSIGSNTTIDRAVFDSTKVGEFSNIDNLVQIAHNVIIGNHAIIASQVGIAGSTVIGDYVKIGGQAGISGHLKIGNNVTIAGKSGVTKNILDNKIVAGFPAKDINLWKREVINLGKNI